MIPALAFIDVVIIIEYSATIICSRDSEPENMGRLASLVGTTF